jgi:hypothetical protein
MRLLQLSGFTFLQNEQLHVGYFTREGTLKV